MSKFEEEHRVSTSRLTAKGMNGCQQARSDERRFKTGAGPVQEIYTARRRLSTAFSLAFSFGQYAVIEVSELT
jgi:hypothetical protein